MLLITLCVYERKWKYYYLEKFINALKNMMNKHTSTFFSKVNVNPPTSSASCRGEIFSSAKSSFTRQYITTLAALMVMRLN